MPQWLGLEPGPGPRAQYASQVPTRENRTPKPASAVRPSGLLSVPQAPTSGSVKWLERLPEVSAPRGLPTGARLAQGHPQAAEGWEAGKSHKAGPQGPGSPSCSAGWKLRVPCGCPVPPGFLCRVHCMDRLKMQTDTTGQNRKGLMVVTDRLLTQALLCAWPVAGLQASRCRGHGRQSGN